MDYIWSAVAWVVGLWQFLKANWVLGVSLGFAGFIVALITNSALAGVIVFGALVWLCAYIGSMADAED